MARDSLGGFLRTKGKSCRVLKNISGRSSLVFVVSAPGRSFLKVGFGLALLVAFRFDSCSKCLISLRRFVTLNLLYRSRSFVFLVCLFTFLEILSEVNLL